MTRAIATFLVVLVLGVACAPRARQVSEAASAMSPAEAAQTIPLCDDLPAVRAPDDQYADSPIYVANEQPSGEVLAWAQSKPGFEGMWVDRDRLGWITLAFSEDADARQADLDELFPEVGVVAVAVDWTEQELAELQERVDDELNPEIPVGTGRSIQKGVVTIFVAFRTADRIAAIEERFAGERVCVEGGDPADAPAPGPQATEGDGWRLLADEQTGQAYRTGIATDAASYQQLWRDIGLSGDAPGVDFAADVVLWFGAVYGSSCPELRLDAVLVDHERSLVYAEIKNIGGQSACTMDANPRAYLVSFDRVRLPAPPFAIQLSAHDPPRGVPEERTIVEVDLRQPGSIAAPGDIHGDPNLPPPFFIESGNIVEPGFPIPYRMSVHCGVEWLGELNEIAWRTDVPTGATDYLPPEWESAVGPDERIELSVLLELEPEPTITATANGHAVVYHPTPDELPGCD